MAIAYDLLPLYLAQLCLLITRPTFLGIGVLMSGEKEYKVIEIS